MKIILTENEAKNLIAEAIQERIETSKNTNEIGGETSVLQIEIESNSDKKDLNFSVEKLENSIQKSFNVLREGDYLSLFNVKISLIKIYRQLTGLGLAESKRAIERLCPCLDKR